MQTRSNELPGADPQTILSGSPLRTAWTPLVWGLYALTALSLLIFPLTIHQDCAMYLETGRLLLEGKIPYVDFVDINPPLIMYLNVIPAFLARFVPVHRILVFDACVLLLAIWSSWQTRRLLERSRLAVEPVTVDFMLLAWGVFHFGMFVSGVFGQREHLFITAFLPFFTARWIRWNGGESSPGSSIAAGVIGAVMTCLKPHFLLIVAAPELYWLLTSRKWRACFTAESFAFLFTGLAYGLHFLLLPGVEREALFGYWIPFIRAHYDAYNQPLVRYARHYLTHVPIVIAAFPLLVTPRRRTVLWSMARPLAIATLAAMVVFFMQQKGWYYQRIAALGGSALLLALILGEADFLDFQGISASNAIFRLRLAPKYLYALMILTLVLPVFVAGRRIARGRFYPALRDPIAQFIEERTKPGDPILWITTNPEPAFPALVHLDRRQASRHLWGFAISMFYSGQQRIENGKYIYHTGSDVSTEEKQYLKELAEDVAINKPNLILINEECLTCPVGFKLADYVVESGFAADGLRDYDLWGLAPGNVAYIRKPGA